MSFQKILIANRGEIAIRISKAASALGIKNLVIYSQDDVNSLHIKIADESRMLDGIGVPAYLNVENILENNQLSIFVTCYPYIYMYIFVISLEYTAFINNAHIGLGLIVV